MRFASLLAAAALAITPVAFALQVPEGTSYGIANPHRPGAKAPDCTTLEETLDGCTFHNEHGATQQAKLPVTAGDSWIATPGDPGELRLGSVSTESAQVQVISFTPQVHGDADATLTFDRVREVDGTRTVVERRRVSVMIHGGH